MSQSKKQKAGVLTLATALVGAGASALGSGEYYAGGGLMVVGMAMFGLYEVVQDKQIREELDFFAGYVDKEEAIAEISKASKAVADEGQERLESYEDEQKKEE